ncbi:iron-dependent peroxidase [Fredinandcohnia quinoae]|uniref:Iron-dependent peroxidase n=1 Tax=Fredinandcohnia quinoae TaxID=2918902 RepID=A0AAW5E7J7_9BACI|nr:iron-dependent peroxidase [Fredinandcohnia sp. SECRCQ15]MCH1625992.1 iron-dependent peroxidase [Fredinandcohnia sp. SECRCQ15]
MNYIWDLVIKAESAGLQRKDLTFTPATIYSPYMELSYEHLNTHLIESNVEINPYYRFHSIFHQLLDINFNESQELRWTLFDIVTHLLVEIDVMQGMSRREFYIHFLMNDIQSGVYGEEVTHDFSYFQRVEKEIIANNILRLHETGETIYLLKDSISQIFKSTTVYVNCDEKDELLIYIGQKETEEAMAKMKLIMNLFLPISYHVEMYWQYHFGIIDIEKTMRIDRIALY